MPTSADQLLVVGVAAGQAAVTLHQWTQSRWERTSTEPEALSACSALEDALLHHRVYGARLRERDPHLALALVHVGERPELTIPTHSETSVTAAQAVALEVTRRQPSLPSAATGGLWTFVVTPPHVHLARVDVGAHLPRIATDTAFTDFDAVDWRASLFRAAAVHLAQQANLDPARFADDDVKPLLEQQIAKYWSELTRHADAPDFDVVLVPLARYGRVRFNLPGRVLQAGVQLVARQFVEQHVSRIQPGQAVVLVGAPDDLAPLRHLFETALPNTPLVTLDNLNAIAYGATLNFDPPQAQAPSAAKVASSSNVSKTASAPSRPSATPQQEAKAAPSVPKLVLLGRTINLDNPTRTASGELALYRYVTLDETVSARGERRIIFGLLWKGRGEHPEAVVLSIGHVMPVWQEIGRYRGPVAEAWLDHELRTNSARTRTQQYSLKFRFDPNGRPSHVKILDPFTSAEWTWTPEPA
ncbi:hypothetical protein [Deinococcus yavapaiensis]|uniref:Uncharacterized protein n=1 Tax=Deinococcus yavapaiensis KR-236 TaxID=694435 RepID=A0A318S891_9DEIO|nr:hypothetical protein [Deinococcus yavapaiensis]PYE52001.1 hypothetical protein DES52_11347 [Deinococcus yavapaiensis KR-236]